MDRKYERDIDLLLAEEFEVSRAFASWFIDQTKFKGKVADVVEVAVSKSDRLGESDLVILFEEERTGPRFAIFIEDKIDAPLQPEQEARYRQRAELGLEAGHYSEYTVVLCAPEAYLRAHPEAGTFDRFVSYERMAAYLKSCTISDRHNAYRAHFLENAAAHRQGTIREPIRDEETTAFWNAAYDLAGREFPDLEMKRLQVSKGQTWIDFRPREMPTMPIRVYIALKGGHGKVDLTFSGVLTRKFSPLACALLEPDMRIEQTGKSTAIRLEIEPFQVSGVNERSLITLRLVFTACVRLIRFYRQHRHDLDAASIHSLPDVVPYLPTYATRVAETPVHT